MKFINFTHKFINILKNLNFDFNLQKLPTFNIQFNHTPIVIPIFNDNKLIQSNFLPNIIEQDIITFPKILSFRIDNINFFIYGNKDKSHISKIKKLLLSISSINNFLRDITKSDTKIINVSIYLSTFKKEIIGNDITPFNVNSGFTNNNTDIYIYREEEWTKVLIHELIHAYKFDNFQKTISPFFPQSNDYIYEAITEFYAIILHSKWISHITNISFSNIINYEIKFNIYQNLKIIKHLNIYNKNDFINIPSKNINMKTSIFSYFIVKLELLLNYNKYKNELSKNILPNFNLKNFKIIQFFNLDITFDNNLRMSLFQIDLT